MAQRAFVIGGGLAGMTVAKELTQQGTKVFVIEASDRLGGKAGADWAEESSFGRWPRDEPSAHARSSYQEHGYHIFPGWYRNTRALMDEIGVSGNLIDLHRFYHLRERYRPRDMGPIERALRDWARSWRPTNPPEGPLQHRLTSFEETWPLQNLILNVIDGPTRPHYSLLYFYALLDLAGRTLSHADHLDRISANGFLSARPYVSEDVARFQHQTVLQASAIPNYEISAMTIQKLTQAWFQTPSPMVSILAGNLQEEFIAPFERHLRASGVTFLMESCIKRLIPGSDYRTLDGETVRNPSAIADILFEDGRTLSDLIRARDPEHPVGPDDDFVLATPLEQTLKLVDLDVDEHERRKPDARPRPLSGLEFLTSAPMAALHLYFDEPLPGLPREHVFLTDSRFGVSLIDISQHWSAGTGAGAGTTLSLIASNFESLRAVYDAYQRDPSLSPKAVEHYVAGLLIDEVARYITLPPCRYHLAPNFDAPLFLNTVGAWTHRPGTRTRFANLYVTGDYCRSEADLTSMESAVGSARETAGQVLSDRNVTHTVHADRLKLPGRATLLALKAGLTLPMLPFGAWNALVRGLRRLTLRGRHVLVAAPYSQRQFATPFKATEALGLEFFTTYAKKRNYDRDARARTGLMRSLDDLASSQFNPERVHNLIREFYEHTYAFDLKISIRWHHIFRPLGALYRWFVARPMKNLVIPDDGPLGDLDSWLETIDKDWDGEADYTIWIRVARGSTLPVYVGAYRTYRSRADDLSYVSVAFPWPIGSLTTVLVPTNLENGGFQLDTRPPEAKDGGVYLIFPGERRFSMIPTPLSERFQLRVHDDETIRVKHHTWAFGCRAITIEYTITRKRDRDPATWDALARTAENCDLKS